MRIAIIAIGSRGDVQPYVALGVGLRAAGHDVRVVTHAIFASFVRTHGLDFGPIRLDPRETIESAMGTALTSGTFGAPGSFLKFLGLVKPATYQVSSDCIASTRDADGIVYSGLGAFLALDMREKFGMPTVGGYLQPLHPTREFPSTFGPTVRSMGGTLNMLSWRVARGCFFATALAAMNRVRRELLGLPPLSRRANSERVFGARAAPALYAISPAVLKRPSDWGAHLHMTGYWFLDTATGWEPPLELVDFLESGPPPVYVGFGSMCSSDPLDTTQLVVEALAMSGQRGILATGWGGMRSTRVPHTVYTIASLPHDWLFPKTVAVVHHGGAGTTSAGLRAGIPSIVVPSFVDQPFWAERVRRLGTGPVPFARRKLTPERLAESIVQAVSDSGIRERAAKVGAAIRSEDGVAHAVKFIERHFAA